MMLDGHTGHCSLHTTRLSKMATLHRYWGILATIKLISIIVSGVLLDHGLASISIAQSVKWLWISRPLGTNAGVPAA
jgi:hypothetical protein